MSYFSAVFASVGNPWSVCAIWEPVLCTVPGWNLGCLSQAVWPWWEQRWKSRFKEEGLNGWFEVCELLQIIGIIQMKNCEYICSLYLNYWCMLWSNICLQSIHILSSAEVTRLIYILEKHILEHYGKLLIYSTVRQYHSSFMNIKRSLRKIGHLFNC